MVRGRWSSCRKRIVVFALGQPYKHVHVEPDKVVTVAGYQAVETLSHAWTLAKCWEGLAGSLGDKVARRRLI
jgi:hypothetical protein